jgi:aryl-alcohol dehydrogenase-like predicted oxidoreductase
MVELCRENGIALLCYGSVLGGLVSERYLTGEAPAAPYENRSLTKYMLIVEEFGGFAPFQELLGVLHDAARKHGVDAATIASRWVLDRAGVAAVIVGARDASHVESNRAVLEVELDDEDRRRIEAATARRPGPSGDVYALERQKGGRHAGIMRYDLNARAAP